MSIQKLDRVLTAYRIGDPTGSHEIFSSEGSRLSPGRWNTDQSPMIYSSEHFSTAMLEKLVHNSGMMPPGQHFISIIIPTPTSYEVFQSAAHPGWDGAQEDICKAFGESWHNQCRSALLFVPSIPARIERNILINPSHPDAAKITYELPHPVWWDERLYG